jgi:hypothetical protein
MLWEDAKTGEDALHKAEKFEATCSTSTKKPKTALLGRRRGKLNVRSSPDAHLILKVLQWIEQT